MKVGRNLVEQRLAVIGKAIDERQRAVEQLQAELNQLSGRREELKKFLELLDAPEPEVEEEEAAERIEPGTN